MEDPSQRGRGERGNGIAEGSNLNGRSSTNDSSTNQILNMVNLATMSDSQFRESLDALLGDNFAGPSVSPPMETIASEANRPGSGSELVPTLPEFPCTNNFGPELTLAEQTTTADIASTTVPPNVAASTAPPSLGGPMLPPPVISQMPFVDPNTGLAMLPSMPNMFPPTFIMSQPYGMPIPTASFAPQPPPVVSTPVPSLALPMSNMAMVPPPAPVSLGQPTTVGSLPATKKRARLKSANPREDPTDASDFRQRRADRNAREQQRAQQVTDQIALLRSLLEESGVTLSKTDKFSTLIMVENYIRSLQTKSAQLAADHQQLLLAMQQTNDHVSSIKAKERTTPPPQACSSSGSGSDDASKTSSSQDSDEEGLPAIKGINYKWIFNSCPFPVAIASIDGRFMEVNKEFEELTGYSRKELLPMERKKRDDETFEASKSDKEVTGSSSQGDKTCNMSIFNVLHRDCIERLFCPMSKILQLYNSDDEDEDQGDDSSNGDSTDKDTIAQEVQLCKRSGQKAKMRVTLVRSSKGLPRFFYCVLIPVQENNNVIVAQFG